MNQKLNKQRTCIVTGEVTNKEKMIRVVKLKSGDILVNSNSQGRGCYISTDVTYKQVMQKKVLDRAFKTKIFQETYEELKKVLKGE